MNQPFGPVRRLPPHTASPAHHPLAQAHWKLYPPSHPVTSTASPITDSPGTAFAIILRDDRSPVSTHRPSPPPWRTLPSPSASRATPTAAPPPPPASGPAHPPGADHPPP